MERRFPEKMRINLSTLIFSGNRFYKGIIENISKDGMEYLITSSISGLDKFIPERMVQLNFKSPSGESLNLNCEVIWFVSPRQNKNKLFFGTKIINPPPQYKGFIDSLNIKGLSEKISNYP